MGAVSILKLVADNESSWLSSGTQLPRCDSVVVFRGGGFSFDLQFIVL